MPLSAFTIAPARHEIMWRDGTAIGVHPVLRDGVPEPYLRAVPGPDLQPVVVDLRRVAPSLAADMPAAPERDRVGLVFYTLRHRFGSAREFHAEALRAGRVDVLANLHAEAA